MLSLISELLAALFELPVIVLEVAVATDRLSVGLCLYSVFVQCAIRTVRCVCSCFWGGLCL